MNKDNLVNSDSENIWWNAWWNKNANIFQGAFEDIRLWLRLYWESSFRALDGATFEYRYWFHEYAKPVLRWLENVCLVIDSIIEESINTTWKASEALIFWTMWKVSNRVFLAYGFPSPVDSINYNDFNSLYAWYFSFLNEVDDVWSKKKLCNIFEWTKTFQGRKHIFEELLHNHISEYEVFQWFIYTTQVDWILRQLISIDNVNMSVIFDYISHAAYNVDEVELYLGIIFHITSNNWTHPKDICDETLKILSSLRKSKNPLSSWDVQRILKTIIILKIHWVEPTKENIEKHEGLYTYIPSIFSSTHGEDSSSVWLVKWFIKSHRPSSLKWIDKHKRLLQALLWDFSEHEVIKKWKAKVWIMYNRIVKKWIAQKLSDWANNARNTFGELKMDVFLKYIRKSMPDKQWDISPEVHKKLMKQYFLIDTILSEIENDIQVREWKIEKTLKSKILRFILWRWKTESIWPFATQAWIMFMRFPLIGKFLAFVPVVKFIPILLIVKTSFIFFFYKLVDVWILAAKQIPFMERSIRFWSVDGSHSISASSELNEMLINSIDDLRDINRSIWKIQKIKKLKALRTKFESNLYDANMGVDWSTNLSEHDRLELSMLENEIAVLNSETNVDDLSKAIIEFKIMYLWFLEKTAQESNIAFS